MTKLRGLLRLLLVPLCISLAQPLVALAQTNTSTPLPPAAQEAIDKGIIAAKVPDYLLAIRYFDEARKLAPQAPVVYLNMGLAESRIPGRELRAMAWFGAYLAAYPDAPNVAAVKEQIGVLEVRNQSNLSRLIKSLQNAAIQNANLRDVAKLYAEAGDIAEALKAADLTLTADWKRAAQTAIAEAQIRAGDIAGAQNTLAVALATADLIVGDAESKSMGQNFIAEAQIKAGDIAGAEKTLASALRTADLIRDANYKSYAQRAIAEAQVKAGDIAGAQKTADSIQHADLKSLAQSRITQAKSGIANAPSSARQSASDTQPSIQPVVTVSDWLKKLDDDNKSNDCPLSTGPFLDLPGQLNSLPPSDSPRIYFDSASAIAEKLARARNSIAGMLKQQAKK